MKDVQLSSENKSFQSIHSEAFKKYGNVLDSQKFASSIKILEETKMPIEENMYVASDETLENDQNSMEEAAFVFGEMELQSGYCNGYTSAINAMEFHKSSEINAAATDLILCLGKLNQMKESFSTDDAEFFYIKKGEAFEVFAETLHFAPMAVSNEGFKCLVILPKGTNEELTNHALIKKDKRLFKKNKWLLAHPERKKLIDQGAWAGLNGENTHVKWRR
ncbi:DUF4867 family protein [Bacillus daqingensis]|uniref:DUF4867 family protein n=1 Tax=Bacillus daqingensis TaxID=872396 RepID=A0ABV9NXR1_9BACI